MRTCRSHVSSRGCRDDNARPPGAEDVSVQVGVRSTMYETVSYFSLCLPRGSKPLWQERMLSSASLVAAQVEPSICSYTVLR